MADTLNVYIRTAKAYYEQISNLLRAGKRGIEQLLFGIPDVDISATFSIDRLIKNPYGVAFRRAGESSAPRSYTPGVGTILQVPRTSEKTPITEDMRDSVVAGIESTSGQGTHALKMLNDIILEHTAAHQATKAFLAWEVLRTGKFSPKGFGGVDIGLEYDFNRAASQDTTYDFTLGGATIDKALGALYDLYRTQEGDPDDIVVTLGTQWLLALESDTKVLEKMKANLDNAAIKTNRVPPELFNTQGLRLIGQYRVSGTATAMWITTYSPGSLYIPYEGASAQAFFPSNEAVIWGLNSPRYRVLRGVEAFGPGKNTVRVASDLVFDTFSENDPITTWHRSQTRYMFVPGNINHTARSVGTF